MMMPTNYRVFRCMVDIGAIPVHTDDGYIFLHFSDVDVFGNSPSQCPSRS